MHIKTVQHDYDPDNPRTWPVVESLKQNDNGSDYCKSKLPPIGPAYDQPLMADMTLYKPMVRSDYHVNYGRTEVVHRLFVAYPFNFDLRGQLREYPHLPKADLEIWLKSVTKPTPDQTLHPATTAAATETNILSQSQPKSAIFSTVSPETAFQHIMKTLDDAKDSHLATNTKLESEVRQLRDQVLQGKEQASRTEQRIVRIKATYTNLFNEYNGIEKERQSATY